MTSEQTISISQWKAFEKQHTGNLFFGDMETLVGETGELSHPVQFCQSDIPTLPRMDNTWSSETAEL